MTKKRGKAYFGRDVEEFIIKYNLEDNPSIKEKIYNDHIHPAFLKLVENNIFKHINQKVGRYEYGNRSYSDLKHEFVAFMYEQLPKYKSGKGKAFSYFNRININRIYGFLNSITESSKISDIEIYRYDIGSSINIVDLERDLEMEIHEETATDSLQDFCESWSNWGISHLEFLFESKQDQKIANAIFNLFINCHSIDIYKKKALYIMIREQVETKTQNITTVIKVLKDLYSKMYREYLNTGTTRWGKFIIIDNDI